MPIFYHLVKREILAGEEAGKVKFFAQVRIASTVDMDKLCDQVAELSTATRGDVKIVLDGMVSSLCNYLAEGYVVQMGDWGNFRLSAGSEGVDTEKEFKLHMMRSPKIIFSPGRLLRNLLGKLNYVRIKPKVVIVPAPPCTRTHVNG